MENVMEFSFITETKKNVRIIEIDGEPWFVLKDVYDILGLTDTSKLSQKIKEENLARKTFVSGGQSREFKLVNEKGLYRIIFRSNKKEAERFQDWVFDEVLPSIRKTGKYEDTEEKFDKYCPVSFTRKQIYCQMGRNIKKMGKDPALVWYIYFKQFGEKIGQDFYSCCKKMKKKPILWLEENNLLEDFKNFCS